LLNRIAGWSWLEFGPYVPQAFVICPQPSVHPQPTELLATQTFEQLRDGVRQFYERLRAIEVQYDSTTRVLLGDPEGAEFIPQSGHHFAFKNEKRFSSTATGRLRPGDSLGSDRTVAFDGVLYQTYEVARHSASVESRKQRGIDSDAYVNALAISLCDDDLDRLPQTDYYLPFALDRAELDWKVASHLDLVGGMKCHVLVSNAQQRLWIAPEIGYAMLFRESHQRLRGPSAEGELVPTREAFYCHRPADVGVWLPWRIEWISPAATINCSKWVVVHTSHRVTMLAANDGVPDDRFTLRFPVGTRVNDRVRRRFYRVGKAGQEINLVAPDWYLSLPGRRR